MRKALTYLFFLITLIGHTQNLIPNPSLESYSILPWQIGQLDYANHWSSSTVHTTVGPGVGFYGNSSYYHLNGSISHFHTIAPSHGLGQMRMALSARPAIDYRHYPRVTLTDSLDTDEFYFLSFDVTAAVNNYFDHANNLGVLFSTIPLDQPSYYRLDYEPHCEITSVIDDTVWVRHYFIVKPDSNYSVMTLGNYRTDANTIINYTPTNHTQNTSIAFLDNFNLRKVGEGVTISGDSTLCLGDSTTLIANSSFNDLKWAVNSLNNIIADSVSSITVTPNQTTTYYAYNDFYAAQFTIEVYSNGINLIIDSTQACVRDTLMLSSFLDSSIIASNDIAIPQDYFTTDTTFVYQTSLLTDSTCILRDSITIKFNELPYFSMGEDTIACGRICNFYLFLDTIVNGTPFSPFYESNFAYGHGTFSVSAPNQDAIYSIMDTNKCVYTDTIHVYFASEFKFDLGTDTLICLDSLLELNAYNENSTYLWQDGSTNSNYFPTITGKHYVQVTTDTGCVTSDTINIEFYDCEVIIDIPNVFTPNNDGINDLFTSNGFKGISTISTQIYNRWGELVYQSQNTNPSWNGEINNKPASEGTYFLVINYTTMHGERFEVKKSITLLR